MEWQMTELEERLEKFGRLVDTQAQQEEKEAQSEKERQKFKKFKGFYFRCQAAKRGAGSCIVLRTARAWQNFFSGVNRAGNGRAY